MRTVEVTDALQAYLDGLVPKRDPVLARMEEEAEREGIPIVDAHEGALLSLLVRIAGAKRLLELGHRHRLQRHLAPSRHRRWNVDELRG